jgi:PAS domain S-box-containing protein
MKTKLLGLYLVLPLVLIPAIVISISGGNSWLVAGFISIAILLSLWIMLTWLQFVKNVLTRSGMLAGDKRVKTFSFANVKELENQQDEIKHKFKTAADLISTLGHPEKSDLQQGLDQNDPIIKALATVRSEMKTIKLEEEKRNWVNQGLARIGEVLRNKLEVKDYTYQILSNVVKYVNANQGALFIEYKDEEDQRYLEMTASYAYGKRKFIESRIFEGQGLLGQCMLERDFVFITDVPGSYVKITSGLGEATPRNIIVAPLIFNETFCGAIELASFEVLDKYQREFLEKACENIASEIFSLKNIDHTRKLLDESNILARELQMREGEMKQNLEELAATQEEMKRKQLELNSYLAGINNTIASAEFAMDGMLLSGNDIFTKVLGYTTDDLKGKTFNHLMGEDLSVMMMWENLGLGRFFSGEFKMRSKEGKDLWLTGTFNPICLGSDRPVKIIMFAQFTTQEKEKFLDMNAFVHALKATLPVIEFNHEFVCKSANEKALKIFNLSRLQVRNKKMTDFLPSYYHESWSKERGSICDKEVSSLTIPFLVGNQVMYYEASLSVSRNAVGEVSKVILILVKEVVEKVSVLTAV